MIYIQQGDVLLKQEQFATKGMKKVAGTLVHKGQQHHHRLTGGKVQMYTDGKDKFLVVSKAAKFTHEEHKTLSVPKGKYKVGIVVEYDHLLEESRQVID